MNGIDISKVFVIAEAGVNHNGSLELAYRLVDAAVEAHVDAVKFQTFKSENMVSKFAEKAEYQKEMTSSKESQFEMIKKLELSFEDFVKIKKYCDSRDIMFLSTPFDHESADFLENLVPIYKIGSGEITNFPFLEHIAKKRKPIILSTGMSTLGEVEEAINIIKNVNSSFFNIREPMLSHRFPLVLLDCVSNYPASFEEVNLKAIQTLKNAFKLPTGYSDHTTGIEIPIAAVALGAKVIEKHFTLDRNLPGPDHKASLEPDELKQMVQTIRNIEKAFGDGIKKPRENEFKQAKAARKSLVATRDMKKREIASEEDISIKRPGTGVPAKFREIIVGMELKKDIKKDEPFKWEDFK